MKKPRTTTQQQAQPGPTASASQVTWSVEPPLPPELLGQEGAVHDGWQPIRARDTSATSSPLPHPGPTIHHHRVR